MIEDKGNDYYKPILNQSQYEQDSQRRSHENNNYFGNEGIFCQLCSLSYPKNNMYSLSQNCEHKFCFKCLIKQLQQSINKNEDLFCPVDYCPHVMSQNGNFYKNLPNSIHNKYVVWKNSNEYFNRNQSFRMSCKDNYRKSFSIPKKQQNKDQQYPYYKPPQIYQQNQNKPNYHQLQQQQQKMPVIPIPPLVPIPIPISNPNNINVNPLILQPAPINQFIPQQIPQSKQKYQYIPYTFSKRVAKVFYIIFGLPLLFIIMLILILQIFLLYILIIGSFLGVLASIGFCIYFAVIALTNNQLTYQQQRTYLKYSFFLFFYGLFSLAVFHCLFKSYKIINYAIIKNSWIWWIKKVIYVIVYPNKIGNIVLAFQQPMKNQQYIRINV